MSQNSKDNPSISNQPVKTIRKIIRRVPASNHVLSSCDSTQFSDLSPKAFLLTQNDSNSSSDFENMNHPNGIINNVIIHATSTLNTFQPLTFDSPLIITPNYDLTSSKIPTDPPKSIVKKIIRRVIKVAKPVTSDISSIKSSIPPSIMNHTEDYNTNQTFPNMYSTDMKDMTTSITTKTISPMIHDSTFTTSDPTTLDTTPLAKPKRTYKKRTTTTTVATIDGISIDATTSLSTDEKLPKPKLIRKRATTATSTATHTGTTSTMGTKKTTKKTTIKGSSGSNVFLGLSSAVKRPLLLQKLSTDELSAKYSSIISQLQTKQEISLLKAFVDEYGDDLSSGTPNSLSILPLSEFSGIIQPERISLSVAPKPSKSTVPFNPYKQSTKLNSNTSLNTDLGPSKDGKSFSYGLPLPTMGKSMLSLKQPFLAPKSMIKLAEFINWASSHHKRSNIATPTQSITIPLLSFFQFNGSILSSQNINKVNDHYNMTNNNDIGVDSKNKGMNWDSFLLGHIFSLLGHHLYPRIVHSPRLSPKSLIMSTHTPSQLSASFQLFPPLFAPLQLQGPVSLFNSFSLHLLPLLSKQQINQIESFFSSTNPLPPSTTLSTASLSTSLSHILTMLRQFTSISSQSASIPSQTTKAETPTVPAKVSLYSRKPKQSQLLLTEATPLTPPLNPLLSLSTDHSPILWNQHHIFASHHYSHLNDWLKPFTIHYASQVSSSAIILNSSTSQQEIMQQLLFPTNQGTIPSINMLHIPIFTIQHRTSQLITPPTTRNEADFWFHRLSILLSLEAQVSNIINHYHSTMTQSPPHNYKLTYSNNSHTVDNDQMLFARDKPKMSVNTPCAGTSLYAMTLNDARMITTHSIIWPNKDSLGGISHNKATYKNNKNNENNTNNKNNGDDQRNPIASTNLSVTLIATENGTMINNTNTFDNKNSNYQPTIISRKVMTSLDGLPHVEMQLQSHCGCVDFISGNIMSFRSLDLASSLSSSSSEPLENSQLSSTPYIYHDSSCSCTLSSRRLLKIQLCTVIRILQQAIHDAYVLNETKLTLIKSHLKLQIERLAQINGQDVDAVRNQYCENNVFFDDEDYSGQEI